MTPESWLIAKLARESTARISRRVVLELQRLKELQSGDDSGLTNVWDEICVQTQGEESVLWDLYDETVQAVVAAHLEKVPSTELQAIWLQTDQGVDWLIDDNHGRSPEIPWLLDDVIGYITREICELAGTWSNRRIREFLERDWRDDE